MNREDFIKFIPKPTNEDVILYDVSLKELIDVDVPNEYFKLLPIFKEKKAKFLKLKEEIKTYKTVIEQTFLLDPSWSEEIYLQKLQDDMRIYSLSYNNIKNIEDEIKILQKKISVINEKISIQKVKEEKENEEKNININNEIEENKINVKKCKNIIEIYKNAYKRSENQIKELKADLKTLKLSAQQLFRGDYKCFCCGRKIKEIEAGKITNRIAINMQKKEQQLEKLSEEKDKIKNTLDYYSEQLSKNKIELQNNLAFRRNYKKIYIKKSIEILKLEAAKNECLEKIAKLNEKLQNEPFINSKKFLELKSRIEKYKISLENLKQIKNAKAIMAKKINIYDEKENEFNKTKTLITKYLSFLNIYYKIYEQKASQYAGPDYKIKLFEIKDLDIIEILNIFYKGIEYSQLSKKNKEIVDKNLIEKFSPNF